MDFREWFNALPAETRGAIDYARLERIYNQAPDTDPSILTPDEARAFPE